MWKKAKITELYHVQLKAREKMRFCLQRLYDLLEPSAPEKDQTEDYAAWKTMLYLLLDDMAAAVKEQQKLILEPHGYASLLQKAGESIIPLELKDKLKEIKDFDAAFQRKRFFSGFRGPRGRGSRFATPSWKGARQGARRGRSQGVK